LLRKFDSDRSSPSLPVKINLIGRIQTMNLNVPLTKAKLPSGVTYGYVFCHPTTEKPTILFLHGFPSAAYDWRHQISYFSQAGYGVLAPDLLGYGSTDKPIAVEDYRGKKMAAEIVEILDREGISKVHGVGHDWGSYLLSRLANYHSDRFFSYSFLDVAYMPPGIFDIDAVETDSIAEVGYERLGFWRFLIEDGAMELVMNNVSCWLSSNTRKTDRVPVQFLLLPLLSS
jgi:soluble epoxide hydrolase / lipid-phosphate phosphatase